ncbi:MAG: outer membrane lipoprotein chaperone LolA [Idiomarina sp.]|nr:outer membrane lipoprotein chaperone LolA [Idiomarina sp.]
MKLARYFTAGAGLLSLGLISLNVYASSEHEQLRDKLRSIDTLQAAFAQQVFDERGELQEELEGQLTLKRPHFLRWETEFPDESVMVADGDSVWYYNAFVEQLSIFDQAQDLEQNPMLVLLSDNDDAWASFSVSRDDDLWVIEESNPGYAQVSLAIGFGDNDQLQSLRVDDGQGQVSVFTLSDVVLNQPVNDVSFSIDVDDHVEIDDQRGS